MNFIFKDEKDKEVCCVDINAIAAAEIDYGNGYIRLNLFGAPEMTHVFISSNRQLEHEFLRLVSSMEKQTADIESAVSKAFH